MELSVLTQAENNDKDAERAEVCPGNRDFSNHSTPHDTEDTSLLSNTQGAENNGAHALREPTNDQLQQSSDEPQGKLGRLKNKLNEPVCWQLKVWMLFLIVFILVIFAIFLSVYFCTVDQTDVDEIYNVEDFVVPHIFRGNFTLLNKNLTLEEQSQSDLTEKLIQIYTSSYALGRYFSNATVNPLRNGSAGVEYELTFMMPKEHGELIKYTLSKEVVYHVLLQQLFDEEPEGSLYIEPSSLTMEVRS